MQHNGLTQHKIRHSLQTSSDQTTQQSSTANFSTAQKAHMSKLVTRFDIRGGWWSAPIFDTFFHHRHRRSPVYYLYEICLHAHFPMADSRRESSPFAFGSPTVWTTREWFIYLNHCLFSEDVWLSLWRNCPDDLRCLEWRESVSFRIGFSMWMCEIAASALEMIDFRTWVCFFQWRNLKFLFELLCWCWM